VLLNKEADRTIPHSPPVTCVWWMVSQYEKWDSPCTCK